MEQQNDFSTASHAGVETLRRRAGQPGAPQEQHDEPQPAAESESISEPAAAAAAAAEQRQHATANEPSAKTCRICFGGVEDEPEYGRLISPCLCKGTMKHVHLGCLNRWRTTGGSPRYFSCSTCKYRYNLQRPFFASLFTMEISVHFVTILAFLLLVFVSGFFFKVIAYLWSDPMLDWTYDAEPALKPAPVFGQNQSVGFFERLMLQIWEYIYSSYWMTHMLRGFVVVGLTGVLNLMVGLGTFRFNLFDFGSGRSGRSGSRDGTSIGGIVLVIMVVVGCAKAIWDIYKLVKKLMTEVMANIETTVLDVNEG